MDGRKFLCIQGPFVGCPHQVDGVGVQEQFKVQLDTEYQTFTSLHEWQMGSDNKDVPTLAQQPGGQSSQFFIPLHSASVGTSELVHVTPISSITLS